MKTERDDELGSAGPDYIGAGGISEMQDGRSHCIPCWLFSTPSRMVRDLWLGLEQLVLMKGKP